MIEINGGKLTALLSLGVCVMAYVVMSILNAPTWLYFYEIFFIMILFVDIGLIVAENKKKALFTRLCKKINEYKENPISSKKLSETEVDAFKAGMEALRIDICLSFKEISIDTKEITDEFIPCKIRKDPEDPSDDYYDTLYGDRKAWLEHLELELARILNINKEFIKECHQSLNQ